MTEIQERPGIPVRLMYSVPEAAKLLGHSPSFVWGLLRRGELHGVKSGASRKITAEELRRYIAVLSGSGGGS